jgi:hypothetical protein
VLKKKNNNTFKPGYHTLTQQNPMHKLTLLLAVLLVFAQFSLAQQASLKGTVIDTSEKKNLTNSVVALLRKSDSILVTYTRSDKTGQFMLPHVTPGKFVLMVTHPAYADYMDSIEVKDASLVNIGNIAMILKSQLLQEVVVSHKLGAIRIKGDTIEYKADSFYMKAGSTVEDLLKKFPGFQVDKNGKITAQGEAVQKVLVDGEEFFSDDPTIATRGIQSDAIDKVQVFDKKSDQATFTGIDDGQKIKTIDLKLKEDKKKGYFGKLEAGTNGDKYWNNSAMINAFKGKRKFSAFGIMSSTGKIGLDWSEQSSYGQNNFGLDLDNNGDISYTYNGGDDFGGGWGGSFYGDGLPKGWTGGLHYSNKWNGDKIHLNGNYKYNKLNTEASGYTRSQYILPDTLYYVNETGNNYNTKQRNQLDGIYEWQIDSSSSLKVTASGSSGTQESRSFNNTEWLDENGQPVRTIAQRTISTGTNNTFNSTATYRKRFKKPGRTFSLSAQQNYTENETTGQLYADNKYFANGQQTNEQIIDQKKLNESIVSTVSGRLSYTEPLSKKSILEFNYGISNNHRQSRRTTLEQEDPGNPNNPKYDQQVDSLSNDYGFNVLNNSAGINYRYAKPKKITFSFGLNVARADYTRKDLKRDSLVKYSFNNFFPQARLSWTMGQLGNMEFNYNGNTQAPSIDQIQPVADNSDQSNIRLGNPDLKQAFNHRAYLRFNSYKVLSDRNIYINMSYSNTQNAFSSMTTVKNGQRISQPVNVNGNYSFSSYGGYYKKIKVLNLRSGFNMGYNTSRNANFIDGQRNVNKSHSYRPSLSFWYEKEKKFSIAINPGISYNISNSSLRPDIKTKYWAAESYAELNVFLPWKMEIGSDAEFNIRQKTDAFDKNTNSIRWNARLDKKILKNDKGIIRVSAFDILNQNISYQRNINSNFINERNYDTFRRYFMLSLIWNFSSTGATPPQQ